MTPHAFHHVHGDPHAPLVVDGQVPKLGRGALETFERRVWRWRGLARAAERRTGVPAHWTLAIIFAESSGRPDAVSPRGAVGLMQLHSSAARQGHSFAAVRDPELNVSLGAAYLARLRRLPGGSTLAHVASRYNAGQREDGSPHPDPRSPWGLRAEGKYIERVARASNTARERLLAERDGARDDAGPLALALGALWWLLGAPLAAAAGGWLA